MRILFLLLLFPIFLQSQTILEVGYKLQLPNSLGGFYSTFTEFLGFKSNSEEGKLMGLAPYGEPRYVDVIKNNLIDIKDDGSFRLNLDYFDYYWDF
jgi:carbamoyltransferase